MSFNHYAKIKEILRTEKSGWYIKKIDTPTKAKNFQGDTIEYPYYFRIYSKNGEPVKYCKFQQLDRLAKTLSISPEKLPMLL